MKTIKNIFIVLSLVLCSAFYADAQERFKRDLEQVPFIPKGQWITGISVSYSHNDQDNYQFLIIEDLSGDSYTFKVSPMLMYSFKDDMAIGGRFAYSRQMSKLDEGRVVIDSETDYSVDNLYCLSHNYSATAAFRNYISMGNSKRFAFFAETRLELGGGETKLCNGSGDDLSGTFERNFNAHLGVAPGVMMFLNNYSALEVNVGVLGFGYSHTKATTDQIYRSERNSSSASLSLNLFSISFGVSFYL